MCERPPLSLEERQAPLYLSLGEAMTNSADDCILTTFCVSKRYCTPFTPPVRVITSLVEKDADINTQVRQNHSSRNKRLLSVWCVCQLLIDTQQNGGPGCVVDGCLSFDLYSEAMCGCCCDWVLTSIHTMGTTQEVCICI